MSYKKNKNYADLIIVSNNLTPEEITLIIGIKPDKSWKIGDIRRHMKLKSKNNGWKLDSQNERTEELKLHLESLVDRLMPYKKGIQELLKINKGVIYIRCVCYFYEANPSFCFETELLKKISELGITLSFDLYCLNNVNNEEGE